MCIAAQLALVLSSTQPTSFSGFPEVILRAMSSRIAAIPSAFMRSHATLRTSNIKGLSGISAQKF
jgi:hypothetical protein